MKVKLPKILKLGIYPFQLRLVHNLVFNENDKGIVRFNDLLIELDEAMNQYERAESLHHEILHQVNRQYSLKLSEEDIDRIAEGLTTFISALGIEYNWDDIPSHKRER